MTEQSCTYLRPSRLTGGRLALETSGGSALTRPGPAAHPRFFTGFLTEAAPAAAGLSAVAEVARTRCFLPVPEEARDPVVTCDGDRLRFESFSACCGVYARLDVLSGVLDGEVHDRGTTNVDVNEPLRRALARVGGADPLHLAVGPEELTVTTRDGAVVEKKVPLPQRWLRGFAEVQVITADFDPRAELPSAEAARFLRALPAKSGAGGAQWAVPAGHSLRLSSRPVPGAVCLAGPERLKALAPLLPFVRALRAYGPPVRPGARPCASAWEFELPGMRLTVALSPEVRRGFSGEGAVLDSLTGEESDADLIGALLAFEPRVEVDLLADRSGLPPRRVRAALTRLGTGGRVGYDLAEAGYFHRELPYDSALAEALNPRLVNARALVAAGDVRMDGDTANVGQQRVRFSPEPSCTCPWWAKYRGSRGKCKHVLAVEIVRGGSR
ncbi:SWIM zinc finger family protein [Streptomyces sp. HNM0575]|uniref:SWIM zinc finger family protein n=1 Tax=Streptomyces sp. HNM0575 TaxID=2716338 RepID=UPI0019D02B3B|nr:SWIM zinc finger family protein [Streptomyces sp. HNM0575]